MVMADDRSACWVCHLSAPRTIDRDATGRVMNLPHQLRDRLERGVRLRPVRIRGQRDLTSNKDEPFPTGVYTDRVGTEAQPVVRNAARKRCAEPVNGVAGRTVSSPSLNTAPALRHRQLMPLDLTLVQSCSLSHARRE